MQIVSWIHFRGGCVHVTHNTHKKKGSTNTKSLIFYLSPATKERRSSTPCPHDARIERPFCEKDNGTFAPTIIPMPSWGCEQIHPLQYRPGTRATTTTGASGVSEVPASTSSLAPRLLPEIDRTKHQTVCIFDARSPPPAPTEASRPSPPA